MNLCFIMHKCSNVYSGLLFGFFSVFFFLIKNLGGEKNIGNRSSKEISCCFLCTFLFFLNILSLTRTIFLLICFVDFFFHSPLTPNEFGVLSTDPDRVLRVPEAAERGWNLASPSSGFCSKYTLLFDVTLLPGRLLSPVHRCDSTAAS